MSSDRLKIDVQDDHLIAVSGELDLASAPHLQSSIETLHHEHNQHLQIDLSGVTFCDSTGIGTLVWAYNTLASADQPALINPSQHLFQLITITGLQHLLGNWSHEPITDA